MLFLLTITTTISFVLYSKWQFSDDRGITQGKWHPFGAAIRALLLLTPYVVQQHPESVENYALCAVLNAIIWELGINIIALKQKPLYVGGTSDLDKLLGKYKWYILLAALMAALLFKFQN